MRLFQPVRDGIKTRVYYIDYTIKEGKKPKHCRESTGATNRRKAEEILALGREVAREFLPLARILIKY